ncbi:hypothetical protein SDC9_99404 [bioreactor metagenome]|uniref:WbqC-like protein family protein n=1 Tax=bioreactor metagenome TaxID=1076179 RepID=A0A645ASU1_9ZZZZ
MTSLKIAIMQPYFFPYLGYFQLISSVEKFLFYDNLTCSQKWIAQNRILEVNRAPLAIFAPVIGYHMASKICEVKVETDPDWKNKFLRKLYFNYKNAAFYSEGIGMVEEALGIETDSLSQLNIHTVSAVARFLDIPAQIAVISAEQSDRLERKLDMLSLARQGCEKKVQRILEICRQEQVNTYVNARGGIALYDKAVFTQNGVQLLFNIPRPMSYQQLSHSFTPDLSIIDVVMNCGREGARALLEQYDLI